jgi:hypothetical protein
VHAQIWVYFFTLVGFEVLAAVDMKSSTFWDSQQTKRRYIPEERTLFITAENHREDRSFSYVWRHVHAQSE